jgi:hypothetical protein
LKKLSGLECPDMSAAKVLKVARAAGVQLGVDGTGRRDYSWSAEVWRVFFDEWAGIVECDGGLPHAKAEERPCAVVVSAQASPAALAAPTSSPASTATAMATSPPKSAPRKSRHTPQPSKWDDPKFFQSAQRGVFAARRQSPAPKPQGAGEGYIRIAKSSPPIRT